MENGMTSSTQNNKLEMMNLLIKKPNYKFKKYKS